MKNEIIFDVTQDTDGGYTAEALGEDIFTQADTWEELRANVREAVAAYTFDQLEKPSVRIRLTREEVLA
ncbi:MAG: 2-phospho-L-lactate guanylyltransferase [Kiritimatiellae bacterium]|jgi:predicted RNase H-like HicB family nuclease|nr:2-phospho-L-lactate guanylyltransferase [Kiritimatiellia bacterium]MDD2348134.1 2-phospho-L-lactate guanylyltransferase [Kiritimatiellia bacterium]MDD3584783.1 2-phospho-L-lactate guanylyltransferase [Kiritimatiellia bacterium]